MGAAYTEVTPVQMRTLDVGRTDAQVRQALEDRGIEYLIWQVDSTSCEDWNQRIVSPAFLKDHSTLLTKSGHTYLFALGEDLAWEQGSQMLPAFDTSGFEEDWIPCGEVSVGETALRSRLLATSRRRHPWTPERPMPFESVALARMGPASSSSSSGRMGMASPSAAIVSAFRRRGAGRRSS